MTVSKFDIYPAIDLRHGRVVRLQLGNPDRQTVFSDDPVEVARRWQSAGAKWLHIVNLDGAFEENGSANWAALEKIADLGIPVQFGGGLRTADAVAQAFDRGASRVILGTAALESPELVVELVTRHGGETIVAGIDAQGGHVRTRGWRTETTVSPLVLADSMRAAGVKTIIYTDISRDGVLTGVNVTATASLARNSGLAVIASGGVSSIDDVKRLRTIAAEGITGVIIGRALYEGRVDLVEAIAIATNG
jgi:phosphoribosylformimino-5-aminoimidazole carboxamide ribotide isomerase